MPVDVVAEKRRRIFRNPHPSARQQAALDERLEAVADAQDEALAGEKRLDLRGYLRIAKHIGDELAAAVGLVARREAAREREDLTFGQIAAERVDRRQDVGFCQVAEHREAHTGAGGAESGGRVVVAVGTREHRKQYQRFRDGGTGIDRSRPFAGHVGELRDGIAPQRDPGRIDFLETAVAGPLERSGVQQLSVDADGAVGHRTQRFREGQIERPFRLHEQGTVAEAEQFVFVNPDIEAQTVAESHLGQSLAHPAEDGGPGRHDTALADLQAGIIPDPAELVHVGRPVHQRFVPQQVYLVAGFLEFGRDDPRSPYRRNAESDEGRRYVDVFERAAHRVFPADRGQAQRQLHPQGS